MRTAAAGAMGSGWDPSDFKEQAVASTDFRMDMRKTPRER